MPFSYKVISTFFVVISTSFTVFAQTEYSISGTVKSQVDLDPIAGAQIFLNGSTIGTLSDGDGHFTLSGIPEGAHDLIVQSLGFESVTSLIRTDQLEDQYSFVMKEKVYNLDEITVKPNSQDWKYNFEQFRKMFIGVGPFSKNTKIKNKEVVNFDFDLDNRTLNAFAYETIEVENKDLGYRIFFFLESFEIDYKSGRFFFYGQTFFEEMSSRRKKTRNKWKENREKAYLGSFAHFTKSLIDQKIVENGFVVKAEKRDDDARYLYTDTVPQSQFFHQVDSSYYEYNFVNFLNITYKNEYEDITYLYSIAKPFDSNPRLLSDYQNSSITLISDSVLVDRSGFILDPTSILFDGYWAFEKLSDMLPLTYEIPADLAE
jgi:hypothetical protein